MEALLPEEIHKLLMRIPEVASHLSVSFVIEYLRVADGAGFDVITTEGWRMRHGGKSELCALPTQFLPTLQSYPDSRLIVLCDARTGRRRESGSFAIRTRAPHAITEAMHGLKYLFKNQEFDAFLHAHPDRLFVVIVEDASVQLRRDLGQHLIPIIHRSSSRNTIDEEVPDLGDVFD